MKTHIPPVIPGPLVVSVGGRTPAIHDEAWVAPSASISGSVGLEARASVWYGASVRGDLENIGIGRGSNVQDCSSLHADPGFPLRIGESVSVGHGAVLHGCEIGDRVLVGMSATIMNGAVVGADSIIGAGALVTEGLDIPPRSLVLGFPARVVRPVTDDEVARSLQNAADYVALAQEHAHGTVQQIAGAR
jgi:carbonic anhydrase/acetyltransferase-like protein (isoleucine patch superfamily)